MPWFHVQLLNAILYAACCVQKLHAIIAHETISLESDHVVCDSGCRYVDALPPPPSDVLSSLVDRRDVVELFDVLITQPLRSVGRPEPLSPDTIQPPDSGSRRLIVLDGLDECDPADRDQLFEVRLLGIFLMRFFLTLRKKRALNIVLLFSNGFLTSCCVQVSQLFLSSATNKRLVIFFITRI